MDPAALASSNRRQTLRCRCANHLARSLWQRDPRAAGASSPGRSAWTEMAARSVPHGSFSKSGGESSSSSFPRKRESRNWSTRLSFWTPAFAGLTSIFGRRQDFLRSYATPPNWLFSKKNDGPRRRLAPSWGKLPARPARPRQVARLGLRLPRSWNLDQLVVPHRTTRASIKRATYTSRPGLRATRRALALCKRRRVAPGQN